MHIGGDSDRGRGIAEMLHSKYAGISKEHIAEVELTYFSEINAYNVEDVVNSVSMINFSFDSALFLNIYRLQLFVQILLL